MNLNLVHGSLAIIGVLSWGSPAVWGQAPTGQTETEEPRVPITITLIEMDLDGAKDLLRKHDLDDNGSLSKTERERLGWSDDVARRFDIDHDGNLQHVELALKVADERMDAGIVQMDSILADRYTAQYDADRDGKLTLTELENNFFTDAQHSFDRNDDGELSHTELIKGLAFERSLRDELGIKGCDQGGAIKLINRGDQDRNRRIDETEREQAGLKPEAMDYDRNSDGMLSVSELAELLAVRRQKLGMTPADQIAARNLFRQIDRDRDGVAAVSDLRPSGAGKELPDWDQNNDGKITELEIEIYFGERRKELGYDDEDSDRATTLIQRNDMDGNGSLSKPELVASGSDRNSPISPTKLPLIDQDRNGKIDVTELARYLSKTQ
tara:strand:+ start:56914 stop:58059 length:1146 start_codon:yes stop_codon:yes gene_type:complete